MVADEPLRLNSEPVPAETMPVAIGDHAARVAAAVAWLEDLCGDYAPLRRQFVARYFDFVSGHLARHRDELTERLKPYDGLYAPDDFLWSALRPLPRGWVPAGGTVLPADMVFWDGTRAIAIELSPHATDKEQMLTAAGIIVCRIEPAVLTGDPMRLDDILPQNFQRFWTGQVLPSSPFRRPLPPRR